MTRITYTSGHAPRPKPKVGDRRTTKKHGLQIRVWQRAKHPSGQVIGFLVSNGRAVYEWRKPEELARWDEYLLTPEERLEVEAKRKAAAMRRVMARTAAWA